MKKPIPDEDDALPQTAAPAQQLDSHLEFVKWLAILTMVIDHAGYIFGEHIDYMTWRSVGRLCWPLIAWIVAMRLYVAPERTKGYLKRLLPWAIIAQAPYAFVFSAMKDPPLPWYNAFNIFFTIGLGCLIFMMVMAWQKSSLPKRAFFVLAIIAINIAAIKVDYGSFGVITIPVLAFLAQIKPKYSAIACGFMAAIANFFVLVTDDLLAKFWIMALAPLAASAIAVYCLNNYLPMPRLPRWFFYAFYPLHLILLVILVVILFPPPAVAP